MTTKTHLTALAVAATLGAGSLMHSQDAKAGVVIEAGVPAVVVAPPSFVYPAPVIRYGYPYGYYGERWQYRYPRYRYEWHDRDWRDDRGWRDHEWREHEWRDHDHWRR